METVVGVIAMVGVALVGAVLLWALDRWARPGTAASARHASSDDASPFAAPETAPQPDTFEPLSPESMRDGFTLSGAWDHAVNALNAAPWPLFVGGLLMSLFDSCNGDLGDLMELGEELASAGPIRSTVAQADAILDESMVVYALIALGLSVLCIGSAMALRAWLNAGWIRLQHDAVTRAEGSFLTLFGGRRRFWPMLGWRLVQIGLIACLFGIAVGATAVPALAMPGVLAEDWLVMAGGIFVVTGIQLGWLIPGLLLGEYFVALEGDGPFVALRRSMDAARGHRLRLLGFWLVWGVITGLFGLSGLILFCVGVFLTFPLGRALNDTAWCRAFLVARHGRAASTDWL